MKKTFLLHIEGKKADRLLAGPGNRNAGTEDVGNTAS